MENHPPIFEGVQQFIQTCGLRPVFVVVPKGVQVLNTCRQFVYYSLGVSTSRTKAKGQREDRGVYNFSWGAKQPGFESLSVKNAEHILATSLPSPYGDSQGRVALRSVATAGRRAMDNTTAWVL